MGGALPVTVGEGKGLTVTTLRVKNHDVGGRKPRQVRNFWVTAKVDGRDTPIRFGPAGATGGFELEILMRDEGEACHAARIEGFAREDGTLELRIGQRNEWPPVATVRARR